MTAAGRGGMKGYPDRDAARARLTDAGIRYAEVKAWAVESGRWYEPEVRALNPDAVDAYLAVHAGPDHVAGVLDSPYDALFADPTFWRALADQADAYGPLAPEPWRGPLSDLCSGARGLLALVDADGASR